MEGDFAVCGLIFCHLGNGVLGGQQGGAETVDKRYFEGVWIGGCLLSSFGMD